MAPATMSSLLTRSTIRCPRCRSFNSIITVLLALDSRIACSRCHAEIGRWRDLVGSGHPDGKSGR